MNLGTCKEDTSCSSAPVRRHINPKQTPYHPTFSESLNERRPNAAEIASYEILKEESSPEYPKWSTMTSGQALDLPTRNKIGLHTNSYYKKSHPFGRHKSTFHDQDDNYLRIPFPRPKPKKGALLHQFDRLKNHYNNMKNLLSLGLEEYGENRGYEDNEEIRSTNKRRYNIDDYDEDVRLGIEEREKDRIPYSDLSSLHPWGG